MTLMKKYLSILFLAMLAFAGRAQQQSLFTNILLNQYIYNTAYAGIDTGTTFNAAYRSQWVGFEGAPRNFMFSGYGTLRKNKSMTLGGMINTERIGLIQNTGFYVSYCYKLKINKKYAINFGLALGAVQYNIKVYDAKPYDADDQFLQSPTLNALAFDANAGFYFYSKKFFLGFSNQHMPNSKIMWDNSLGRLTPHFYAYTGYNFSVLDKKQTLVVQPSILVRTDNPAPYQLEYHLRVLFKDMVWLGASFRQKSTLSFLAGAKIDNRYTIGYAYDFTLSKLSNYSSGSHEIYLSILIPFKKKKSASEKAKEADEEELNKIDNTLKTNLRAKKKNESSSGDKGTEAKPQESTPAENATPAGNGGDTKKESPDVDNKNTGKTKTDNKQDESGSKSKPKKKAKKKKYKKRKSKSYKR